MNADKQRYKKQSDIRERFPTIKKSVSIRGYLWLIFFAFALHISAQTYENPVIPGNFPDPSVIRVGADYYATTTTGGWSPEFPILHSTDLINWKIVGAVFDEKPKWAKNDFWAPEIVADKGRFFVYYTARRDEGKDKKGTLCVAVAVADKPDGFWHDKGTLVCQKLGSIDPDFARDENGKPFLIWKEDGNDQQQPTWLYAQELDESGTRLMGKPHQLFRNTAAWEGGVIEGAYILRRGEYFYLFYSGNACCGRACDYALGVARSKTLLGKWEKNPNNPILPANETWQCPGHGSIVETPDNRAFLLYHAYQKNPVGFTIGREALLDEVKFADGWATINDGRGASKTANVPFRNTRQQSGFSVLNDEFGENSLAPIWSQPIFDTQTARLNDGFVALAPTEKQLAIEKMPEIILAQRTISGNYTATTRVDFSQIKPDEFAGIAAYSWGKYAAGLSLGNGKIFAWRREDGKQTETAGVNLPKNETTVLLKITAENGTNFNFTYSADGENWQKIGDQISFDTLEVVCVALIYNGKITNAGARFDWIKVVQN